jgi:ParB/RepB/Spo0J family partition protein
MAKKQKPADTTKSTRTIKKRTARKAQDNPGALGPLSAEDEDKAAGALLASAGIVRDGAPVAIAAPEMRYAEVPIGTVTPSPLNPRKTVDDAALAALADSIAAKGILQPLLARPAEGDIASYEIICGERRYRAAAIAIADGRLPDTFAIPIRVRPCGDDELVILAATENLARKDMTPLEEAEVFAALRGHVSRREDEDVETAIARTLGTSRRTVFRRLSLLRLAPELKKALAKRDINLQQAEVFSLGDHNTQRAHLKRAKGFDWNMEPQRIRESMVGERVQLANTSIDPALYTGDVVEDLETGARYATDLAQVKALFDDLVKAKTEELAAQYPWVKVETGGHVPYGAYQPSRRKNDPEAGAVIACHPDRFRLGEIQAPVITLETARQRERERNAAARERAGEPAEPEGAKRLLSRAQIVTLKLAKTRALRRAISAHPKVGLALAILGLLGARDVLIGKGDWIDAANHAPQLPQDEDREATLLRPLAELLMERGLEIEIEGVPWHRLGLLGDDEEAELFRVLVALELDQLLAIQAHLVAERCGTWITYDHAIGDTPLAVAIAEATAPAPHLMDLWSPDEAYFKAMTRERLVRLIDAYGFEGARHAKKGELVAWCLAKPQGFWTPDKFPETAFADDATLTKALQKNPAPSPARAEAAE